MKKMVDFYENFTAPAHFQKHFHFLDQPIINFYERIYARIVCKNDKNQKYLTNQK